MQEPLAVVDLVVVVAVGLGLAMEQEHFASIAGRLVLVPTVPIVVPIPYFSNELVPIPIVL